MTSRPTGNQRTDAKNKLGLSGLAPVDPAHAEVLPRSGSINQRAMDILTDGGSIVRSTHPGVVGKVFKAKGAFIVEVVATDGVLNRQTRRETAFTRYQNLGTVDVVEGEEIAATQQLGTVAYQRINGQRGMSYRVFKNGSGSAAAEAFPESDEGIAIVKASNPSGIAPNTDEQLRKQVSEGGSDSPKLAPTDNPGSTSNVQNSGPRSPNAPFGSRPQVNFAEQKNQVYTHDFLVFINGVDITKYVVGSLQINLVDKDGYNEANLVLNNAQDNFVITLDNLGVNKSGKPVFRSSDISGEDKYSERAKEKIIEYKRDEKRNPVVDIAEMKIVGAGFSQGVMNVNTTGFSTKNVGAETPNIAAASRYELGQKSVGGETEARQLDRRWQLGFQSTVFHKNDPIRIFRKNPIREADEWMPAFTGYLENISYDTNYVTGVRNVKLTCYDIRAIIQKMRVQTTAVTGVTNPRAVFLAPPDSGVNSLFSDLLDPSINAHPLANRRFEDVMEFLTTGSAIQDPKLSERFKDSGFSRGIGDFTVGDKIFYKPGDTATGEQPDPLEHWHALCLFGMDGRVVNRGDEKPSLKEGKAKKILGTPMNRRWLTENEARAIGAETTHDGNWAPHAMFVHFLLPAGGTGAENLLQFDAFNANSNHLEFRGLLDIMQDFANRIDYQFWVSPMGDIIIEFPQYDFLPRDYGEYEQVFRVNKHLQSDNVQDEAGDMTTAIIAHGRISPVTEAAIKEPFQPKAIVVAPLMMMRYGVLEHELTLPFIADTNSLRRIAQIEFQKKLADSNRMDMQFDYRPFITPNRPMENFERQRLALTTAVLNTLEVFKSASTSISARYVRRALFRSDNTLGYTLITGGISMPISYRQIYEPGTTSSIGVRGIAEGKATLELAKSVADPSSNSGTGVSTNEPVVTPGNQTTVAAISEGADKAGFTPAVRGRITAIGQQMSSFTETSRNNVTSGFGIFQMRSDVRGDDLEKGAFGIGDSTNIDDQISAAVSYFGSLQEKFKGDTDEAVAEFCLGTEKVKNIDIRKEFDEGFGKINKELGEKYEETSQVLKDGFNELSPGETEPTDTETAKASEAAKKATTDAEEEGPVPSNPGYQSTVGVLVYDNSKEQARLVEESAVETQRREATVSSGRT